MPCPARPLGRVMAFGRPGPEQSPGASTRLVMIGKLAAAIAAACLLGCSSNSSNPASAATCSSPGGPVSGPADSHCGTTVLTVDPSICAAANTPVTTDDAGADTTDYGATMFNAEGDDDDCKYHVSWTSTPICDNTNVTFNMRLTAKVDGSPVTGADPNLEVFLNLTHPGLISNQTSQETSAGNYSIGPVQFDARGQWTVRFHVFPTGCDQPTSPHGHAAFYVNVP